MKKKTEPKTVYLDTSIFAGKVLLSDAEDKKCALLIKKISDKEFDNYTFITSIFTLVELAELISRKETEDKAKIILFDILLSPFHHLLHLFWIFQSSPHFRLQTRDISILHKIAAICFFNNLSAFFSYNYRNTTQYGFKGSYAYPTHIFYGMDK